MHNRRARERIDGILSHRNVLIVDNRLGYEYKASLNNDRQGYVVLKKIEKAVERFLDATY
ncbi:MAG: hypothetical protein NXY59_01875 [Aigarchaeota archaeon]|nr:hypothetical protein [Candidatus Pelearchaeum maunauluense]